MTKRDLIEEVAQQYPRFSRRDAEVMVNAVFDSMTEALAKGERIEIRGFGSFIVKQRDAREGRKRHSISISRLRKNLSAGEMSARVATDNILAPRKNRTRPLHRAPRLAKFVHAPWWTSIADRARCARLLRLRSCASSVDE